MPQRKNPDKQYQPGDFSDILQESKSLGVLVGGMAVNIWAEYYLKTLPELRKFSPFISRDADFIGGQTEAREVQQRIGWKIQTFRPGEAGSPVSATLTSKDGRLVEILYAVIGLNRKELESLSTRLVYGKSSIIILTPPALLKAKLSNLDVLNQEKSGRQDLKQTQMLVPISKQFLKDMIEAAYQNEIGARQVVFYLNTVFQIINDRTAIPYRQLFGERGEKVFPVEELKNSSTKSFQNFYLHRISSE